MRISSGEKMKVIVLGSGVIGVCSAFFLALEGHDVTIIDRKDAPAMETSFANAGEISPGYASPWANPAIKGKLFHWLRDKHSPLVIRLLKDPSMYKWLKQMWTQCNTESYMRNKSRMVPLAEYSRDQLMALRNAHNFSYDSETRGTMQIFRDQESFAKINDDLRVLREFDVPYSILQPVDIKEFEPGLDAVSRNFVGAIMLPGDETGDCHKFTNELAELCHKCGVKFMMETSIKQLMVEGGECKGVTLADGSEITADAVVVAMGSYSVQLMKPQGIKLPIYPVKGYSMTCKIQSRATGPLSTVLDDKHKVAITRLGDQIRVGGVAELCGYDLSISKRHKQMLEYVANNVFPGVCDMDTATYWAGLRPMTYDGPPIIGESPIKNAWLATGHGTLGWTMACGTGRIVADLISGIKPDIDVSELGLNRYNWKDLIKPTDDSV